MPPESFPIEKVAAARTVEKLGNIPSTEPASSSDPHRNLMQAPYWTDGKRSVLILSEEPVPIEKVEFLNWTSRGDEWSRKKEESEKDRKSSRGKQ